MELRAEDSINTITRDKIKELYKTLDITPCSNFEDFKCRYKSSCVGVIDKRIWKAGNWAYVGSKYGEAQINKQNVKVLVIGMDRGGKEGSNEETFEETQSAFRRLTEYRKHPHMGGVSLILERLLDEHDRFQFSLQYALTNAVKCSTKSGNMHAVRNNTIISNCSSYLREEINCLQPDIIITQGKHPQFTIRHFLPEDGNVMSFDRAKLWQSGKIAVLTTPHPARLKGMAYKKEIMPEYFNHAIDEVRKLF